MHSWIAFQNAFHPKVRKQGGDPLGRKETTRRSVCAPHLRPLIALSQRFRSCTGTSVLLKTPGAYEYSYYTRVSVPVSASVSDVDPQKATALALPLADSLGQRPSPNASRPRPRPPQPCSPAIEDLRRPLVVPVWTEIRRARKATEAQ